jgi:hypothetical protein
LLRLLQLCNAWRHAGKRPVALLWCFESARHIRYACCEPWLMTVHGQPPSWRCRDRHLSWSVTKRTRIPLPRRQRAVFNAKRVRSTCFGVMGRRCRLATLLSNSAPLLTHFEFGSTDWAICHPRYKACEVISARPPWSLSGSLAWPDRRTVAAISFGLYRIRANDVVVRENNVFPASMPEGARNSCERSAHRGPTCKMPEAVRPSIR